MNFIFKHAVILDSLCLRFLSSQSSHASKLNSLIMDMTKDTKPQRVKQKTKYAAASVALQVLGSGAKGSPACLYVFSDQSRYLFNCGEGTQRLAHEHKMKLSKLEHLFITHSKWENFGGLPGMCLTLQDSGVSEVVLHGPPQVDNIFWATKRFVVLKNLMVHSADQFEPFEDGVMRVEYFILESNAPRSVSPSESLETNQSTSSSAEDPTNVHGKRENKEESSEQAPPKRLCRSSGQSVGYICRLHPRLGTLILEKCAAQGVPLGPLLGQLKTGKDVTLPCGKVVLSKDVTTPEEPGTIFLVLECPDASYIPSLLANPKLVEYQAATVTSEIDIPDVVVHFSPPEVMELPEYVEWMDRFPPSTMHLALNEASSCQGTTAIYRLQHKLHMLHKDIFPLLPEPYLHKAGNQSQVIQGHTLDKFYMRPKKGLDRTSRLIVTPEEYVQETMREAGFPEELEKLRLAFKGASVSTEVYPRVSFLGTGSCIPNKTRNTSGILLEIDDARSVLLDCGEGTKGQLLRLLGPEGLDQMLCTLTAVYISHLHADHHIGLVGILKARREALKRLRPQQEHAPLLLLAPGQIYPWLNTFDRTYEKICDQFTLVPLKEIAEGLGSGTEAETALNLASVQAVLVPHCPNAFGVALQHKSGWKIVYSGDTEPCSQLIEIGKGCDLLIHEATMEDGLEEEARKKKHSTTSEAIDIGVQMKAKFTLLTHFSQRYAKIPLFNDKFSDTVGIAFDNMRVSLSQLPLLPLLYPALRAMFNKYYEEMEQKTRHKQLKQERQAKAAVAQS